MNDILIVSNYYPPETGAASNRIAHLASGLKSLNYVVSIVCPLPNYPKGKIFTDFRGRLKSVTEDDGIAINRLWLFPSVSKNKFVRLFSMLSFSLSLTWFFIFNKIPKTVIIQSPPLLVAFVSTLFLRSKKRKLILNVSDLWPLAGLELKAFKEKSLGYSVLKKIEEYNYRKATIVLGQSNEILDHVLSICPNKPSFLYRNFPDINVPLIPYSKHENEKIKIVYAGLLGVAQGIYRLCEKLDYSRVELHVYGVGAEKVLIESFLENRPDLPIYYYGELERTILHSDIQQYDIVIIPLLNRIYGSVPSKLFEFSKLGLPILYFGGGEGEKLVKQFNLGWTANAGDYSNLNSVLRSIDCKSLSSTRREEIKKTADYNFNFNKQLLELQAFLKL